MTTPVTLTTPVQWKQIGISLRGTHPNEPGGEFWISPDDITASWRLRLGERDLGAYANLQRCRDAAQDYVDLELLARMSGNAVSAVVDRYVALASLNPATFGDMARLLTDYAVSKGY